MSCISKDIGRKRLLKTKRSVCLYERGVKLNKITKIYLGIVMIAVGAIIIILFWNIIESKEKVTDISQYERCLGKNGKYKEHYNTYNDIFPDVIPENAEVKDFIYYYYNPWDACYMGYLVYSCDADMYTEEYERLKALSSSEDIYIYGATEFPYELCAVYADDYYGYIYALADETNQQFIYVELQFCNGFSDIDYEEYIPQEYLPKGFSAKSKNG